ncbi:hypothetical protein ACIPYR_35055 [Streptomyces parvus]|uniref:hypothetical protein n=1 Tax=Streptomyces parvus TaxID=66428 RepID=UPI0038145BC4
MKKIIRVAAAATLATLALLPGALAAGSAYAGAAAERAHLKGDRPISSHNYRAMADLPNYSVFCDIPISMMDLTRITAVQGLDTDECGTILKVTNPLKPDAPQYVMAVDRGGAGLDLNSDSFRELFGTNENFQRASWEPADPSHGKGIIHEDVELPGFRQWTCDTSGCH